MRFRAKSLTSLLFAFLLALPMISVISKVIYVQSNKNAYESYYGETINEEIINQSTTTLNPNYEYITLFNQNISVKDSSTYYGDYVGIVQLVSTDFTTITNNNLLDKVFGFDFYNTGTSYNIRFYYDNNGVTDYKYATYVENGTPSNLKLVYRVENKVTITQNLSILTTYKTYNSYSYLDNVFEYAVDEVIKENNFGNIDFFSYFTSIFMSDNQVNNRYIGYVNYYLNYALMVSLAYLLFLMLMWFINFARRFLDRGMNYDW